MSQYLSLEEYSVKFSNECKIWIDRTEHVDWARAEHGIADAGPISKKQWQECYRVGLTFTKVIPGLPLPVPGADPGDESDTSIAGRDGFCWLTWERGARRLACAFRSPGYVWTIMKDGVERTFSSASEGELLEAVKQTFNRA